MYRSPSPIFDTPEVLTLRRMKPLPKRRRTSSESSHDDGSLPELPPEAATTDIDGLADPLSAQLALQSYYMPILGGMQELFKADFDVKTPLSMDFGGLRGGGRVQQDTDDGGDGDYVDHIQQPGNTKKRKVPANLGAMGHGSEQGDGSEGGEDETADRAIPTGRPEYEYDSGGTSYTQGYSGTSTGDQRRAKMSRATLAGLSHKEMLKSRKRQLATVLGALAHGDTLALDQALSANYPFASSGIAADLQSRDLIRTRLSRRPVSRLSRAFKAWRGSLSEESALQPFPECDFTFTVHCATSDRLVATKKEVAALHARFEQELQRQAARAAEAAKQTAAVLNSGPVAKRSAKQGRSASGRSIAEFDPTNGGQTLVGVAPTKSGKKKKRSALANASNPHHLRNYVPSRLPHSGQVNAAQAQQNAQNLLSPLPVRFLAADVPPRRKKKASATPTAALSNPAEEWICPFCEYDLFYGDAAAYQRAINSRKKILRRRRRARERAAAAASGTKAAAAKNPPAAEPAYDDVAPMETPYTEPALAEPKKARPKAGPQDSRGDAGGNSIAQPAAG
ncbi:hypothetical protein PsYK624_074580 [Phanerochaete sordida]|uniref:Uncharacterized protein n=1 Tax=Phanerochaete sordida TaxID=48140 RepID=A0A9P3GCG4_9APHY|nr:hypothetical protein PsYK624_074580 [Phanerochaete sordida]